MTLELRPNCEFEGRSPSPMLGGCDLDLPPDSTLARICTYECTFCADCVERELANVCPNCGGGLERRPIRPRLERRPGLSVTQRPASTTRVHVSYDHAEIAAFSGLLRDIPPEER